MTNRKFTPGQEVRLISNPDKILVIASELTGSSPEKKYRCSDGGTYYESQIEPIIYSDNHKLIEFENVNALFTSLLINEPTFANLYSLYSSRVNHVPYQFRPVLKLLRSERPRLLIADDVGVGKTIEAGLILKELQARQDIKSVLVICPKALVAEKKWQTELKRFGQEFTQLDGGKLKHCLDEMDADGEWPREHRYTILPFSLLQESLLEGKKTKISHKKGLSSLDIPPKFDLIIVDEAHHIRNRGTLKYKCVKFFCEHAEAVLLMTATPIQLHNGNLFTLLNVLRPDIVIDEPTFEEMGKPNPHIHAAVNALRAFIPKESVLKVRCELENAVKVYPRIKESPEFQKIWEILRVDEMNQETRVALIRDIARLSTFDGIINRTRRRDISGQFAIRTPITTAVDFTDEQREFYNLLLQTAENIFEYRNGNQAIGFMLSTIKRQASSCLYALAPYIDDWVAKRLRINEINIDGDNDGDNDDDKQEEDLIVQLDKMEFPEYLLDGIIKLRNVAKNLSAHDPKLNAFIKIVRDKQNLPNNKLLVFTSFRHTLAYLESNLRKTGVRIGIIHGGVADDERRSLRQRFSKAKEQDEAIDVLLSTEVGGEGLDFQFCDAMVNYDLPWNPMRIEQRIGRIDRYGQKSDMVVINNLITPNTIDGDIYERCLLRIGVFREALGASEEILGDIVKEIKDIAESFTLTPEQRQEKLDILEITKISQIKEQQELEEQSAQFFGLNVHADDDFETPTSAWLKPDALFTTLKLYLRHRLGSAKEYIVGEHPLKNLRLDAESRLLLYEDYKQIKKDGASKAEVNHWEKFLKGKAPNLQITFEQDCANEQNEQGRDVVLLHATHPLLKQSAHHLRHNETFVFQCRVCTQDIPAGIYPFAIYQWIKKHVRHDEYDLIAVSITDQLEKQLFTLLQKATARTGQLPAQAVFDDLDERHYKRWQAAKATHQGAVQRSVDAKLDSLTFSTKAKQEQAKQRELNPDSRISKMGAGELERIELEFSSKKRELESAVGRADIFISTIAFGVMEIAS
ncbi:MAG: helicase-related protein [Cyclobacteriaceae bacterium]|nr:helicase-related protein [Cyclobacteriaceae bacterium]